MIAGSGVPTAMKGGAPSSTCTAGVVRMEPPTPKAPPMMPATNPDRMPRRARTPRLPLGQRGRGAVERLALGPIARERQRLVEREPPDLLHLVIVEGDVAARGLHEEQVHDLAHPNAVPDVPVADGAQARADLRLQPGLLPDLADGGVGGILAGLHEPLGEAPREV